MDLYPYRVLEDGIVVVEVDGPFDLPRSLRTLAQAATDLLKEGHTALLWDTRRRSSFPAPTDVPDLVAAFRRWRRVAVLTGPPVSFGMARMAAGMADSDAVEGFQDLEDALTWVRSP